MKRTAAPQRTRKPKPGRPWPPKMPKARGGKREPSGEQSGDEKLGGTGGDFGAVVNPPLLTPAPRFTPANDDHLWDQVAPEASWRACPHHGPIPRPLLREWRFADGSYHIKLTCPSCLHGLGYAKRTKSYEVASPAKREAVYRQYVEEAEARGWKPGSAYYRFQSRFGCEPDPAWRKAANAGKEAET